MSKETVVLFFEKVREDEKLQEQMMKLSAESKEVIIQRVLALAAEHGYTFTVEEFQAYEEALQASLVESGELTEEEMDEVAGGFIESHREMKEQHRRQMERIRLEHEIKMQERHLKHLQESLDRL